jgi:hypothetical protein
MYTAYFLITYSYGPFKHPVYVEYTVRDGVHYHPLEDVHVMELVDEHVQLEMNEYFAGEGNRKAENCDIEVYIISDREYNDASSLFLKVVV